jgi:hypothetical protein
MEARITECERRLAKIENTGEGFTVDPLVVSKLEVDFKQLKG